MVTCVGVGACLAWCKIHLSTRPDSYGHFGHRSVARLPTRGSSLAAAFARAAPRARVSRALPRAGSRVLGFGAASAGYAISTRPPSLPRDLPLPRDLHRCRRRDSSVPSSPSPSRSPLVSLMSLDCAKLSLRCQRYGGLTLFLALSPWIWLLRYGFVVAQI